MSDDKIRVTVSISTDDNGRSLYNFRSPSGRTVSIDADCYALQNLPGDDLDRIDAILALIRLSLLERDAWEAAERQRLEELRVAQGKKWISDLPDYADHIEVLHALYPAIRRGEVWLHFTRDQMQFILSISRL